jgi:hypothetical protein
MIKYISFLLLGLLLSVTGKSQQVFQLAPPFIKFSSVFFKTKKVVELSFALAGTVIHYTTNNAEPTEQSPVYSRPLRVSKNFTNIKAKTFGRNFLPSETVKATFIKDGLPLKNVTHSVPDESYTGEGENTLMDNRGGIPVYTSKTWLGFRQDTVSIVIALNKKQRIRAVLFNLLQDYRSWIFFPNKVEVYSGVNTSVTMVKEAEMLFTAREGVDANVSMPFIINFEKAIKTDVIKLQLYLLKQIPDWHVGKGQSSWIFIDEVKLY